MTVLHIDSSAARGILLCQGVGGVRHLSCRILWLQDHINGGYMRLAAIAGSLNPADIGTKRLPSGRLKSLRALLGRNVQYNCSIIRRIRRSWWHFPEEHHVLQILSVLGLTSLISLKGCDENATSNPSQMLVIFTLIFGFACLVFLRWFANMPHAPAAQEEPHDEAVVMNDNPGADTVQWLL